MTQVAFFRDDTPFAPGWYGIRPAGATICADALAIGESRSAAALLRQQVFDLIVAGQPLTATVTGLKPGCDGEAQLRSLCELLGEATAEAGAATRELGVVIDVHCIEPVRAWQLRRDILGWGPLYLMLAQHTLQQESWLQLWKLRANDMVRLACSPFVASQTCLLPDEFAGGVVPGSGLQVPTGSAWVTADVDLAKFADSAGVMDMTRLEQLLPELVACGNELHSRTSWPTAQMRHDAWLNRRLAINVSGFGVVMRRRAVDPCSFAALDEMNSLMRRVRAALFAATQELAINEGNVPALEQADPGRLLPGGKVGDGWSRCWQRALDTSAVRNRNLLAISPWCIFPPGSADPAYANLLPLLRFADVCVFGQPPDLTEWNASNFKSFHQRAAAVLQQRSASHQIAVHA
jgi:hypothetical protein